MNKQNFPLLIMISFAWGQCDFNSDGQLDSLDIVDEVNCIMANCGNVPQCDLNNDRYINIIDICATVDCIISLIYVQQLIALFLIVGKRRIYLHYIVVLFLEIYLEVLLQWEKVK